MGISETTLHATSVAYGGRAMLIMGPSGSGKSALALELISRGASLVSDDRTIVRRMDDTLIASAPDPIAGLIEARGIGILNAPTAGPTPLTFAVDLSDSETARLPEKQSVSILDCPLRCLRHVDAAHFPAAILLCLMHGISDPA